MKILGILFAIGALVAIAASPAMAAGDAAKGKQVYMANCTACHGMEPAKDGALGPAIKGSSEELLQMRVLNGNSNYDKSYPAGYKAKRPTRIMVALPHLKGNIADLAAYLK